MRAKKEKTEFGTVKSVIPKKKKAFYGTVVPPLRVDNSSEKPPEEQSSGTYTGADTSDDESGTPVTPEMEEYEPTQEEAEQEQSTPEPSEPQEKEPTLDESLEKLQKLVESMEEYQKQKAEEEAKKKEQEEKEKTEEPKSEEEKKQDEQQKQKQEQENDLTKYLSLQLKIKALGEIFGAVRIAEKDKEYFSFTAFEGQGGYVTYRTPPAPQAVIVALSVFPYFETSDEVEAFVELCAEILMDYGHIALKIQAQELAGLPIKVTYPSPTKPNLSPTSF